MKIITFILLLLILVPLYAFNGIVPISKTTYWERKMDILFHAIAYVESGNNPMAYNAKENAIGLCQIRLIAVKEVNRIYKLNIKHIDCYKISTTYKVFILTMKAYNKEGDFERGSRCWNAGANGWYVTETNPYWEKVEAVLKTNKIILK